MRRRKRTEKEIQKITNEDAHAAYDTETKTWGMFDRFQAFA